MEGYVLPIFPQGSLSSSVFVTVWVGICILVFFNLRFGWVLSGLVVPGYLVPLLMIKPLAAAAILIEAVVAYLLVHLLYRVLADRFHLNSLFGRDRFFAILLFSILVRLLFDVLLFPALASQLAERFHLSVDFGSDLHSFGLIVVALAANQFWKPGLRRGLLPVAASIGLTWLLVRFVLLPFTNFSLGDLFYMYEDLASSMLASPKAYVILLTTALIASRMNLKYGWEFSGILIPALLALVWYQPLKVGASMVEAVFIYALGGLALKLPLFRKTTMEGARKLLLFFTLSLLYRIALGHVLLHLAPGYQATDAFGFGYVLATLLAVKMHDKEILARVSRATLEVSLGALALASLIGYGLTFMPNVFALRVESAEPAPVAPSPQASLASALQAFKLSLYQARSQRGSLPGAEEVEKLLEAFRHLEAFLETGEDNGCDRAAALLSSVGCTLDRTTEGLIRISETGGRGWGTVFIDPGARSTLLILVPSPLEEWASMEAGVALFREFGARVLVLSAARSAQGPTEPETSVLKNRNTFAALASRGLGGKGMLQVRGHTAGMLRQLFPGAQEPADWASGAAAGSSLWISGTPPAGLDTAGLQALVPGCGVRWGATPWSNVLREAGAPGGFAELLLTRSDRRRLSSLPYFSTADVLPQQGEQSILGYLQGWLLSGRDRLAPRGSGLYVPPTQQQLLFFDEQVLKPLQELMDREYRDGQWTEAGAGELRLLNASAGLLGYEILRYRHLATGRDYLILQERPEHPTYRGLYVLRLGASRPYQVQVPRPLFDRETFEYGNALFERLEAAALLVGGAHPQANPDGSADLLRVENARSLFHLVSQSLLRFAGENPAMVLVCRAMGPSPDRPPPRESILLALPSGETASTPLSPLARELVTTLEQDRISFGFVDGRPETLGLDVSQTPQSLYRPQTINKDLAYLWLAPFQRAGYRSQDDNRLQQAQFAAAGIPTRQEGLVALLERELPSRSQAPVPGGMREEIAHYLRQPDVVLLARLVRGYPGYRWERLVDADSRQAFLLVSPVGGGLALAANLNPLDSAAVLRVSRGRLDPQGLSRHLFARGAWIEAEGPP